MPAATATTAVAKSPRRDRDLAPARRGVVRVLSVAPMMDRTDRHFRWFVRRIARRALLYTEMVTTGAILRGDDPERFLEFHPDEGPLALQLGGDDPAELAACARIAEEWGYDEVNLNIGCPSERVQSGNFGVCLMGDPGLVADGVAALREAVAIPVTVKHRIGFDDLDRYEDMLRFVDTVAAAGCDRFTVHARKAWLKGLSPKENRDVPPLRYEEVYRLKEERPELVIEINGGIVSLAAAREHLARVDAVMMGRTAYDDPFALAGADRELFGDRTAEPPTRRRVVAELLPYAEELAGRGEPVSRLTRHVLGLFAGRPGARAWRRHLSEHAHRDGAGAEVLAEAAARVPDEVLDEGPAPLAEPARAWLEADGLAPEAGDPASLRSLFPRRR
ncbi:MAG TPA: tRNA dihydrouridine(20/20a) synthase DusA [Thermoanaerobaculia bacterium]|nr:tRNA dihydrouridine(20/20a) synthase DusA [Thermoanaerobaculia bacterium]